MPDKTNATPTRAFERLMAKIQCQHNSQVIIVRLHTEAGHVELIEIYRGVGVRDSLWGTDNTYATCVVPVLLSSLHEHSLQLPSS
jgi:hypothetical protein